MAYILDGRAEITVGGEKITAARGQAVVMPADIPHGLEAADDFKMLLILVKR